MDGETAAALGSVAAALTALLAYLRRRRRKGGGGFRPRARFRGYLSLRTHDSAPGSSIEPGPFDEADTGKHKKPKEPPP